MCGIIGIIAKTPVAAELIEGLRRLEYRGYDSAGVATLINGRIERRRAEGKLANLVARLKREPVQGTIGIGQQNTTAIGQQGTGTAITPQTNGFIINADGSVTGVASPRQQGSTADFGLSGTNSGRFGTNRFGTNRFGTRTNASALRR